MWQIHGQHHFEWEKVGSMCTDLDIRMSNSLPSFNIVLEVLGRFITREEEIECIQIWKEEVKFAPFGGQDSLDKDSEIIESHEFGKIMVYKIEHKDQYTMS